MTGFSNYVGVFALAALVGSCGEGSTEPVHASVASVTVSRDTATLVPAATLQLSAVARSDAGAPLQRAISWTTSDAAKASVSSSGLVLGVAPGVATITATSDGKAAVATITVLDGGIVSSAGATLTLQSGAVQIVVPPDALTTNTNLSVAPTSAFAADARVVRNTAFDFGPPGTTFAKGVVLKIRYDAAGLPPATEEGALELYTHTTAGWELVPQSSVDLTAKVVSGSVSHFSTFGILTPDAVASVSISGAASLTVGETTQLTATVSTVGGRVVSNRLVTWSSSDATIASVTQTGSVSALKSGSVTISASAGGVRTSVGMTLNPVAVAAVTVSAPTSPMIVGTSQQLTAVTRDAGGNVLTGRQITWGSSNTAVLTVSDAGLVTAAGLGTATITVTSESVSARTPTITVQAVPVASLTVNPGSATLIVGTTQQLMAVTQDAAGNVLTGRAVAWSSGNTAVATVNPNSGLVSAVAAGGPVIITATSEGKTGTASITVNPISVRASPFITSGLVSPVFLTQPLNDGRMFVVEQGGRIRVVQDGELQTTPFLDISDRVNFSGEQGLLSVAFHPRYATNHLFYVFFNGLNGEIRIERFAATADPSVADKASEKLIFTTPHPDFTNHNGGLVAFGPDGMLYAGFGDGGSGGDPPGNGQNFNAYLGGMIRIDVDHQDPYAVPADNPFVGQPNVKPELWAKGLRNPWRFSFDFPTGLLFIGDVGQNLIEEVDAVPATMGGLNYGWNIMEGSTCYATSTCNQTGLQLPIVQYDHTAACSVIGGYVYRGTAIPGMRGHYFYSDFCGAWLRSLRYEGGIAVDQKDWGPIFPFGAVTSFGKDFGGELYVTSGNTIFKIVPGP